MIIIKYIISILVPNILGFIGGILGSSFKKVSFYQPSITPPGFIFPIVWTILYTLMGTSYYIINKTNDIMKDKANTIYYLQLLLNIVWPVIFFRFEWFLLSFIWIIILLILVIYMTITFYKIDKKAGLLQIPYIIWLLFASYLTIKTYVIN